MATLAVAAGILFLAFGLMLLAGLAAVGIVAGAGTLLLRALRGPRPLPDAQLQDGWRASLDPRLEISPVVGEQPLDPAKRIDSPDDHPST